MIQTHKNNKVTPLPNTKWLTWRCDEIRNTASCLVSSCWPVTWRLHIQTLYEHIFLVSSSVVHTLFVCSHAVTTITTLYRFSVSAGPRLHIVQQAACSIVPNVWALLSLQMTNIHPMLSPSLSLVYCTCFSVVTALSLCRVSPQQMLPIML